MQGDARRRNETQSTEIEKFATKFPFQECKGHHIASTAFCPVRESQHYPIERALPVKTSTVTETPHFHRNFVLPKKNKITRESKRRLRESVYSQRLHHQRETDIEPSERHRSVRDTSIHQRHQVVKETSSRQRDN